MYLFAIHVVPLIVVGFVITWFCKDEREHEREQQRQQQWQCGDFVAEHMARGCATFAQLSSPTGYLVHNSATHWNVLACIYGRLDMGCILGTQGYVLVGH
jgi:hypothetical protein